MTEKVINREARETTKGFRLQKLRAIKHMLETIEKNECIIFYTAIEHIEDISHKTIIDNVVEQYFEEDKNYSSSTNFTISSPSVKNTLVSFFDIYSTHWQNSDEVKLGFYTTASIGKEKKSIEVDGVDLVPPDTPILKQLAVNEDISDETVSFIKAVLVEEYKSQYSAKKMKGNLATLEQMGIVPFKSFLAQINWEFGSEDDVELKKTVMQLIRNSRLHNIRVANKEGTIFSLLMEILDERQYRDSLATRVVNSSDVKLIFFEAASEESDEVMDPTWEEFAKIEITDKRTLEEKIRSVCLDFQDKKIKHFARLACRSKSEGIASNKSFLSLKYRTYEACSEYFAMNDGLYNNPGEIEATLKALHAISNEQIQNLKQDYSYTVSNSQAVNGIIMDLFDSCYISFDEGDHGE